MSDAGSTKNSWSMKLFNKNDLNYVHEVLNDANISQQISNKKMKKLKTLFMKIPFS